MVQVLNVPFRQDNCAACIALVKAGCVPTLVISFIISRMDNCDCLLAEGNEIFIEQAAMHLPQHQMNG
jgi:hypothetical protein